ncbi:hypothetical protein KJZ61_01475 [Candidatus Dependentiae bacterium]|nr:hypothetical protein [Candidatus Dependentiae bacterium]
MQRQKPLLHADNQKILHDALYYMKMNELRKACLILSLPHAGKKIELINRIMTFIQTGNIRLLPVVPEQSKAKNYPTQPLRPDSLMLYGAYRNDAKTRAFFKQLIGPHFHFTAFGIDWLNEQWLKAKPPTYREFAHYWTTETENRKRAKPQPKDEWMFINFVQHMNRECPSISKGDLMAAWKKTQADKAHCAFELLRSCINQKNNSN